MNTTKCSICKGKGQLQVKAEPPDTWATYWAPCRDCGGSGKTSIEREVQSKARKKRIKEAIAKVIFCPKHSLFCRKFQGRQAILP